MANDFYEVLGVWRSASQDEIRRAYRQLALRYHPDRNPDNEAEAEALFVQTQRAYDTLVDPARRAEYDRLTSPRTERDSKKVADRAAAVAKSRWEAAEASAKSV